MVDGILLKLSTDSAVDAQKRFDEATRKSFSTIEDQGKLVASLEERMKLLAKTQASLATATQFGSGAYVEARKQLEAERDAFGKTAETATTLGKAKREAAVESATLGQKTAGLTGLMGKLLAASGNTGAARGMGILGTVTRGLVGAMNPLGIVTGIAASAIISLAIDAATAQTPLDKLREKAADASRDFDLMASSSERVSAGLSSIASQRGALQGFKGTPKEAEQQLSSLAAKLREVRDNLDPVDTPILNIDQIKSIAEALKIPNSELRDLQRLTVTTGKELEPILTRLSDSGLRIKTESRNIFQGGTTKTTVFMEAQDALNALQKAIDETDRKILNLRNAEHESVAPFQALTKELLAQSEAEKLGNKEREVTAKILALTKERNGQLSDDQQNAARTAKNLARIMDEEAEAAKNAAEQSRVLQQEAQRQAALDARRSEILQQIQDDTEVLLATGDEEIRQKKQKAQLNTLLSQTETDLNSAAGQSIKSALDRLAEAERANEKMRELRSLGQETFGAIGQGIANAISNGGNFRTMLQNIASDLERIALQKALVESLAKIGGSLFSGRSAPSSGASAPSSIGAPPPGYFEMKGGLLPSSSGPSVMAMSGVLLDRYQTFAYGGKRITTNEGGAATPEAVFPLTRDSKGRLGLSAAGGGGGNFTINMPNVRSADDARRIRPTVRQMIEQAQRSGTRGRR